ncbi:MAG: DUF86 domain-containing protein [Candidatus Aegiribacteria sp.]|nr:DUF86 domain-containing protein [Candidatus Aegiribacteria sp.]
MHPEDRDAALIFDIISAAHDIERFVAGVDLHRFEADKMLRYAVERQLLVIGEAAKRLSEDFRKKVPSVPWNAIIGLRNILAHEYGEVLTERIWLVAIRDLRGLVEELLPYLRKQGYNEDIP